MSSSSSSSGGGIGFFGLLTIVFIVLKLTHVLTWSWIWVLCPLWAPMGVGLVFLVILFVGVGIISRNTGIPKRKTRY